MSEDLTDDEIASIEARNAIRRVLRSTFGTTPGKRALTHILRECKFFQRAVTAEAHVLQQFAIGLLEQMGVYNELPSNAVDIVESLLSVPFVIENPHKERDDVG